jgi:hypothetical protein
MQADLIRASRTPKKNTNQNKELTRISTVSSIQKEKNQPQQVRFVSLKESSKLQCNNANNLYFSYEF